MVSDDPVVDAAGGRRLQRTLAQWQIVRSFDTADDCNGFLSSFFESSQQKQALNILEPAYRDYMFAKCIATDDPRLREK
jgi:hypothetical protein